MGFFDKKTCSICGGKLGLIFKRKLEDGNLCKDCASKLSPFFSDRRNSTVEEIKEQLKYREENKSAVAAFKTTRSFGANTKILLDEDHSKFMVTSARNLAEANPDVMDYSMVTGVDVSIEENSDEVFRKDSEGNSVSYHPPKYDYSYDFNIVIRVNHPYFDTINVQLNPSSVETTDGGVFPTQKPIPDNNPEYCRYRDMCNEVKEALLGARQQARDAAAAAAAAPVVARCSHCGANTTPDESGCCAFCGSPMD